jgi:hypothetical protein
VAIKRKNRSTENDEVERERERERERTNIYVFSPLPTYPPTRHESYASSVLAVTTSEQILARKVALKRSNVVIFDDTVMLP